MCSRQSCLLIVRREYGWESFIFGSFNGEGHPNRHERRPRYHFVAHRREPGRRAFHATVEARFICGQTVYSNSFHARNLTLMEKKGSSSASLFEIG